MWYIKPDLLIIGLAVVPIMRLVGYGLLLFDSALTEFLVTRLLERLGMV